MLDLNNKKVEDWQAQNESLVSETEIKLSNLYENSMRFKCKLEEASHIPDYKIIAEEIKNNQSYHHIIKANDAN